MTFSFSTWLAAGLGVLFLIIAFGSWRRFTKVLTTVSNGMDLFKGQDFSSRLAKVGYKECDSIVELYNNLMKSLKDERLKVREQNHLLDLLINKSPLGIMIFNGNGYLSICNPVARDLFSIDEGFDDIRIDSLPGYLGSQLVKLHEGDSQTFRLSDSRVYRCSRFSFMNNGYSHPFLLIEQLTDEVIKAERRGYEKVIRMMAHEVNNSMGAVSSILDTSIQISHDSDITEGLQTCLSRCEVMSRFVTSLADVVKIPEPTTVSTNLNSFVRNSIPLLEGLCNGRDISIKYRETQEDIYVELDPVLLQQVLINIVKNAVESIDKGGEITLSIDPGGIVVSDNGPGIPPEIQQNLFTPFFTTKKNGKGIGLLLISDIIKKHGWNFSLRSDPDGLTSFRINFNP